ncbi:MAG: hypothetical protein KF752_20830 [Pirellulaceae bacterium]|nr:hypothetical protein [Pirellulaceae bacterium]
MLLSKVGLLLTCLLASQPTTIEYFPAQATTPSTAQLVSLGSRQIELTVGGQSRQIALTSLRSLRFPGHRVEQSPSSSIVIRLLDGSRIAPRAVVSSEANLDLDLGPETKVTLSMRQLASVQFQALSPAQQNQWDAIMDSRISGDTLVLIRSPESLDKIEGSVGQIGPETIEFDFAGQKIAAPRAKLAGLRLLNPAIAAATTSGVVRDVWGNVWNAASLECGAGSDTVTLALTGGATVNLPLHSLLEIDFSVGSLKYIADLSPLAHERLAGMELKLPIVGGEQLFGAQTVQLPKGNGPSLCFIGSGTVTYRVPKDYCRLEGSVYLAPTGNRFTACKAQVKMENEVLWEQLLEQPRQRVELNLDVQPDTRIQLSVIPQVQFPVGDVVVWEEIRLLK